MPTLRSIGIHPALRSRLVTESVSLQVPLAANDGSINEGGIAPNDNTRFQLIDTPQALLCRNPASLKLLNRPLHDDTDGATEGPSTVNKVNIDNVGEIVNNDNDEPITAEPISISRANQLRQDVAVAMINESHNGKVIQAIRQTIDRTKGSRRKRRRSDINSSDSNPLAENENNIDDNFQPTQQFSFRGTVSVLEMLQFSQLSKYSTSNNRRLESPCILSTGCKQLDELISLPIEHTTISCQLDMLENKNSVPGLPFGYVTQICGPPGSGKSQMALQLASSQGLYQTWYLCSDGSLHTYARRLSEIAFRYRHHYPSEQVPTISLNNLTWKATVLKRTIFATVSDEFDVLRELARLESHLINEIRVNETNDGGMKPTLLLLDSCSGCLSGSSDGSDRLLATVADTVKRLTRTYSLATFLVNGTVTNRNSKQTNSTDSHNHDSTGAATTITGSSWQSFYQHRTLKPALGRLWWKIAADVHVWIDPLMNGTYRATLERHPSKVIPANMLDDSTTSSPSSLASAIYSISGNGIQGIP